MGELFTMLFSGGLLLMLKKKLGLYLTRWLRSFGKDTLTSLVTWFRKKRGTKKEFTGTPAPTEKFNRQNLEELDLEFEDREGYDELLSVLKEAYEQASIGKGRERHAHGDKAFTDQQILTGQRKYGMGFALGQADKKMEEAFHMSNWASARRDLLGVLVYVSAAILYGDEVNQKNYGTFADAVDLLRKSDDVLIDDDYEDDFEDVKPPIYVNPKEN
jgi:hypothetical protein